MTTKTVRVCDGCGKEVHEHAAFVTLVKSGRQPLSHGPDLEFCNYYCLLQRMEKDGHIARFEERKGK